MWFKKHEAEGWIKDTGLVEEDYTMDDVTFKQFIILYDNSGADSMDGDAFHEFIHEFING